MLVLSRKPGERIVIGRDIVISVVDIQGGRVRLGISAPPAMPVHREEIFQRIQAEVDNEAAVPDVSSDSRFFAEFA